MVSAAGRGPMPVSCSRSCHCPEAYVAGTSSSYGHRDAGCSYIMLEFLFLQ